ncbi:MAG: hypothetical protein JXR48_13980 [Candidatus Delongbacteria bacterium]|nr:hypothetical protein [Candidatus Delongbacteria bacterium]MBN2836065.1 hypothetical protein [Candidatus Delongbacteria bacterium]
MIKIFCNSKNLPEKKYVYDFIFNDQTYDLTLWDFDLYKFELNDQSISFPDLFLNSATLNPVKIENVKMFKIPNTVEIPVFWEKDMVKRLEDIDFCGTIFYILSLFHEYHNPELDEHARIIHQSSIMYQTNTNNFPVCDILRKIIRSSLSISNIDFVPFKLTFDIDILEKFGKPFKLFAGDLLKRKSPKLFISNLLSFMRRISSRKDPYDRFETFIDLSKSLQTIPYFFLIFNSNSQFDAKYYNNPKELNSLLTKLGDSKIGIHYSYNSILDQTLSEDIKNFQEKIGIKPSYGRAHYLRFRPTELFNQIEKNGLEIDFSLGYSKISGFRAGTSRDFQPWNFKEKRPYAFLESPLGFMDSTFEYYNKKNPKEILEKLFTYTLESEGSLNILLHNSSESNFCNIVLDVLRNHLD